MAEWLAALLERQLRVPREQTIHTLRLVEVALAAMLFVLMATVIVAFDSVFPGQSVASLAIGNIAGQNIHAPEDATFISAELTGRQREAAAVSVPPVFDPPDPSVAAQQTELARSILDFIDNIRRDSFATEEQKVGDIRHVTDLTLDTEIMVAILQMDDETWRAVDEQIISVLERVMRNDIRESGLQNERNNLPTQVAVRFGASERDVIVAVVGNLIRPNTFENPEATEAARQAANEAVPAVTRSFERGQIVVRDGERLDAVAYEALDELGLLQPADRRLQEVGRALLASIIVMIIVGLYVARFKIELFDDPRMLALLAAIFLIVLLGAQLFGVGEPIYLYPTAAMSLLFVIIIGPEVAVIGVIALALLVGIMANNSLEIAALTIAGGLAGIFSLRRAERLNSNFFAGLMVALTNTVIIAMFNLEMLTTAGSSELSTRILFGLLNGVLAAAAAVVGMYIVTLLFNLPTSLKLLELSQPNQPLLQRVLREAPGTYQHSLQVANLCEQAANAVGANAALAHVAALYHDIGKMQNAAFFVENQGDAGNPHDDLNDPYRSADIIISHVTDGDAVAREYRLPNRIRDFIREHHGTSVLYFYQQAVAQAGGDESVVDVEQFTYPGPKPQSRETAIMMLADSCEAVVRARRPTSKQEISDIVQEVTEGKRRNGQLDESNLTLNDLKTIRHIFIDMLQGVFHPRINYPGTVAGRNAEAKPEAPPVTPPRVEKVVKSPVVEEKNNKKVEQEAPTSKAKTQERPVMPVGDDDTPLAEVPPLPRHARERAPRANGHDKDGTGVDTAGPEEKKPDAEAKGDSD